MTTQYDLIKIKSRTSLRLTPNAVATWWMLLQLQKHLQTELRPFQVRSHVTQKLGQNIKNLLRTKVRYCSVVLIHIENGGGDRFCKLKNSNFKGLVTLTLTLDRVIRYTIVHHSSTSIPTYQISSESEKTWTDGRTDGLAVRTFWPMLLGRLFGVDLKRHWSKIIVCHKYQTFLS